MYSTFYQILLLVVHLIKTKNFIPNHKHKITNQHAYKIQLYVLKKTVSYEWGSLPFSFNSRKCKSTSALWKNHL